LRAVRGSAAPMVWGLLSVIAALVRGLRTQWLSARRPAA
jgi:hypothetical protein